MVTNSGLRADARYRVDCPGRRRWRRWAGAAVYWVFAEERGWADTRNHKDLAGRDRFVTARWPGR